MGEGRTNATRLTARREWPLLVRRARPDDEAAVLTFASATWHGWDYIPRAWPVWLAADDGVMLVGCDPEGRPIAVSRVAMLSTSEGWVEGIRVDPSVRGLDVATDLQVAELAWAEAMGATVVRYATGSDNQGSHRLGARHGFELIAEFHTLRHSLDPDAEPNAPSAYEEEIREATTHRRRALLAGLSTQGVLASAGEQASLWPLVSRDHTLNAAARQYEARPWAIQELSQAAFAGHLARGEVIVTGTPGDGRSDWALGILPGEQPPSEDSSLRLALLIGEPNRAVELLERGREVAGESLMVRIPHPSPLLNDAPEVFAAAGYRSPNWALHLLARPLDADHPAPDVDPWRVVLGDPPLPIG